MKLLLSVILVSVSFLSLGQSDLSIESYNFGLGSGTIYKGDKLSWSFQVKNIGLNDASVVDYKIYLSEDILISPDDIILKEGKISNSLYVNFNGLAANNTTTRSQIQNGLINLTLDIEAVANYHVIFWIETDSVNNETNTSNNISSIPIFIGLRNKLDILPVDFTALPNVPCSFQNYNLENRIPLLLVHGWQPEQIDAPGNVSIWDNFLRYFACDPDLQNTYKPYYIKYNSNIVAVDDLGHELRLDLDNNYLDFHDRQITLMAHSMGGLVSRSFAKRVRNSGPFAGQEGGERVNKLITLGTPHHGSPMANGEVRTTLLDVSDVLNPNALIGSLIWTLTDNSLYNITTNATGVYPESDEYNRWDLKWDNHDNLFNYTLFPNEENNWLNSAKMNGSTYFNDKIIAYGSFFNEAPLSDFINGQRYFLPHLILKEKVGYLNDGVVPLSSALFLGQNLNSSNLRYIMDYYHDEIAKGSTANYDANGIDNFLFGTIKFDLLNSLDFAFISSSSDGFLGYNDTALGFTSSKDITIQNTGVTDLVINSVHIAGLDSSEFSHNLPENPLDLVIQPNHSLSFTILFSPSSAGIKTSNLIIDNSSTNNQQLNIILEGLAVTTPSTDFDANLEPVINFGDVFVYNDVDSQILNISNTSSAAYTINNLNVTGADSSDFTIEQQPQLPKTFSPGDSEPIIISFNPSSQGIKNAEIEILFSDNVSIDSADLVGNGIKSDSNVNAANLSLFEIWYNDAYMNREIVNLTGNNNAELIQHTFSTQNIPEGLNILHFRIKDKDGYWSSIVSQFIYVQEQIQDGSNSIIAYEYWFNDDYANNVTNTSINEDLAILSISDYVDGDLNGLNQFHIRFKDERGHWSSVQSEFLYVQNGNLSGTNNIIAYEYWFDDDYSSKTIQSGITDNLYVLNLADNTNSLEKGLHQFHIRFKDSYGNWSSVLTEFIYKTSTTNVGDNKISAYRYWFNDDFNTVLTVSITPEEVFLLDTNLDLSGLQTEVVHNIHFQFKDTNDNWSSVITEEIFTCGVITSPVVSLNGFVLESSSATSYQWYLNEIPIANATNQNYTPLENGNYTVRIADDNGCTATSDVFLFDLLTTDNDDACDAIPLTVNAISSGNDYTNVDATTEVNEPFISGNGQTFSTVWFSFIAPEYGNVQITTDILGGTLLDTEIAVYSTTDCADYTIFTEIGYDQDSGINVPNSSILNLYKLIAGETYYIQVDRKNTVSEGTFGIEVKNLSFTYAEAEGYLPTNPSGLVNPESVLIIEDGQAIINGETTLYKTIVMPTAVLDLEANLISDILFKSSALGSGQLDEVIGHTITGLVTTERYIPPKRAFRLLTSAVNTTADIRTNWQEGVNNTGINLPTDNLNPKPGFGIHISGSITGENGFDATPSGNSSMYTFNNTNQVWVPLANTNIDNLMAGKAYLTMVRGDRSINITSNSAIPTPTILRSSGDLHIGTLDYDNISSLSQNDGDYLLVGNPYQSVIDFSLADKIGFTDYIYIWDASINGANGNGGYVTVDISTNGIIAPSSSSSDASKFIAPGQSFFMQNDDSTTSRSLIFNESNKSTSISEVTVFSTFSDFYINSRLYKTSMLQNNESESDALSIQFNDFYTTPANDEDAIKFNNPDENYAILNNGLRSIDKQSTPIDGHIIDLYFSDFQDTNYSLTFDIGNKPENIEVYLIDDYLNTSTALSTDPIYNFSLDTSIPESSAPDRFSLVFETNTLGANDFNFIEDLYIYPNPTRTEYFYIESPLLAQDARIEIFNSIGQKVFAKSYKNNTSDIIEVRTSDLSNGAYIVKINQKENNYYGKLIISK